MKIVDKIALEAESEKTQKSFLSKLEAFLTFEVPQWNSQIFEVVPPYCSRPRLQLEKFGKKRTFLFFKHVQSAIITFDPETKTVEVTISKDDYDAVKPLVSLIASHVEGFASEVIFAIDG